MNDIDSPKLGGAPIASTPPPPVPASLVNGIRYSHNMMLIVRLSRTWNMCLYYLKHGKVEIII